MGYIRILPDELANQIAAGEVVERPASVVKELAENALDAGSSKIHITLEEGGMTLIRVRDNGKGMSPEDVRRAFMRHATSKIKTTKDLFNIRSLGFRGEALPSIAAVSELECRTVSGDEDTGTVVVWRGGKQEKFERIAHPEGTDIHVRQLFYNTPARLKYLKTVNTEISRVADVVNRLALAYPHVSFELKHEGRTLLHTLGDGRLLHVVQAIYGQKVAKAMREIEAENIDFSLYGYICKPEVTRASRHYITLFVNNRCIRSYALMQAVLDAYETLLPVNRFPLAVLGLTMDPSLIDVNVHPAKLEVRFSKEKELKEWLTHEIRTQLLKRSLVPKFSLQTEAADQMAKQEKMDLQVKEQQKPYVNRPISETNHEAGRLTVQEASERQAPAAAGTQSEYVHEMRGQDERLPELVPLAQVHGTYIVAQSEDSLFLIDQHAAHERIYYEYIRRKMDERNHDQQELLFPIVIELTAAESAIVKDKASLLTGAGVALEPFGPHSYIVRSHPTWLPEGHEEELIRELIDWVVQHNRASLSDLRESSAKQMACKAAIKANRHLRDDEMRALLERLRQVTNPFTCPHGRPILIEFTSYEMEKMFKRVM